MNTHNKNEQNKEVTMNDIKAIKEFEYISDDVAIEIIDSIKQLSLVLFQFQKYNNHQLKINRNNNLQVHKREYKQVA